MMYGWRKTREKRERFLRKREKDKGERVWRCRASQFQYYIFNRKKVIDDSLYLKRNIEIIKIN